MRLRAGVRLEADTTPETDAPPVHVVSGLSRTLALAVCLVAALSAADQPRRKPLSTDERAALLALIKAVDLAQDTDVLSPIDLPWAVDVLKSTDVGYVPFRLNLAPMAEKPKSLAMYVRVVTRRDGYRATEETSSIREWAIRGGAGPPPRLFETVVVNPGEMPIGGVAVASSRRSVQAPAEEHAMIALLEQQYDKERAAGEAAKRREEIKNRDPYIFPFEEYYFFDVKSADIERALAVPPGEYDVFVALVDRARIKTSTPVVVRHTIAVPDFWDLDLRLSSLMFVNEVRTLPSPLKPQQQIEHPYTWGRAEVVPSGTTVFGRDDTLKVVFQICNYGSPDIDVSADYTFYSKVGGLWKLFNRTDRQMLDRSDLPPAVGWETQGFVMQAVPLATFPSGDYKLEVAVKDRLTLGNATQAIEFTVK